MAQSQPQCVKQKERPAQAVCSGCHFVRSKDKQSHYEKYYTRFRLRQHSSIIFISLSASFSVSYFSSQPMLVPFAPTGSVVPISRSLAVVAPQRHNKGAKEIPISTNVREESRQE